jgi:hypothetical protein
MQAAGNILLQIVGFVQMTRIDRIFEDKFGLVYIIIAENDRIISDKFIER